MLNEALVLGQHVIWLSILPSAIKAHHQHIQALRVRALASLLEQQRIHRTSCLHTVSTNLCQWVLRL